MADEILVTNDVRLVRKVVCLIAYYFAAFTSKLHCKSPLRKLPVYIELSLFRATCLVQVTELVATGSERRWAPLLLVDPRTVTAMSAVRT